MKKKQTPPQLLSAYRNLSISAIYDLSDTEALIFLKNIRWGNSHCFHTVQCPRCQIEHKAYFISSRKQWQCKHCQHRFSVKSGTIFQHTKLSLRKLLLSVYYFTINSKGISALNFVILACNIKRHGHYYINSVKQLKKRKITHHSRALFILMVVM